MLHASALLLMTHCSQFLGFDFCWINSWLGFACGFLLFSYFRALSAFSLYSQIVRLFWGSSRRICHWQQSPCHCLDSPFHLQCLKTISWIRLLILHFQLYCYFVIVSFNPKSFWNTVCIIQPSWQDLLSTVKTGCALNRSDFSFDIPSFQKFLLSTKLCRFPVQKKIKFHNKKISWAKCPEQIDSCPHLVTC